MRVIEKVSSFQKWNRCTNHDYFQPMKTLFAVVVFLTLLIFAGCGAVAPIDRFDPDHPDYNAPSLEVKFVDSTAMDTLSSDSVVFVLRGNDPQNIFRYAVQLPGFNSWSSWQGQGKDSIVVHLSQLPAGQIPVSIQTAYFESGPAFDTTLTFFVPATPPYTGLFTRDSIALSVLEGQKIYLLDTSLIADSLISDSLVFSTTQYARQFISIEQGVIGIQPGHRDSGRYQFPLFATDTLIFDSCIVTLSVKPNYVHIVDSSRGGAVQFLPPQQTYRWGDTVSVRAIPHKNNAFHRWLQTPLSAAEKQTDTLHFIAQQDAVFRAAFVYQPVSGCIAPNEPASLYAILKTPAHGSMQKTLCPEAGVYNNGALAVRGIVLFHLR